MSYAVSLIWMLLLLGASRVAAQPRQAEVQVSARACVIGRPVAVVFRVARPAGGAVSWRLVDQAFRSVIVLKTETSALPGDSIRHEVIFTASRGGRCQLGPFRIVAQGPQRADTLPAPAVQVQFRAEAQRPALHPLRPNAMVWQGLAGKLTWAWSAAGLFLLSAGVGGLWWGRKGGPGAAVPALLPGQAQQRALAKLIDLEQAVQLKKYPQEKVPDQLWAIVHEYLAQQPALVATTSAPPSTALLAELTQARFAPARTAAPHAARLLAKARQLVASEAAYTNPAPQAP